MEDTNRKLERTERRRALSGMIILVGLIVLAVLIISLDEIMASRVETVEVHAELPDSKGLASGAPVWIAGSEVGEVVSVSLLPPGLEGRSRVIALARIPREHLPMLRRDSRARVTKPGFVGDALLELTPGTAGSPALAADDTITAEFGDDRVSEALGNARGVLVEVDTVLAQLRQVAALYRERRPMIDEVSRSLQLATAELDRTAAAFSEGPLSTAMADARLGERFARVRTSLATLQQGLGRYTSGPLGARLDALGTRTDSLRAELAVLDSLASGTDGFIGRVQADSALAVEAARTGVQMDSLVEAVKSNPLMFF